MSLSELDMISYKQRQIIVHSYIYYELNDNVISDKDYDRLSKQLAELKQQSPELWKQSEYYKQFGDDYNGCTGFSLYHGLTDKQKAIIQSIAKRRNS